MLPAIPQLLVIFAADIVKSRRRLEAKNLFFRHQLNIALMRAPSRLRCGLDQNHPLEFQERHVWPDGSESRLPQQNCNLVASRLRTLLSRLNAQRAQPDAASSNHRRNIYGAALGGPFCLIFRGIAA